MIGLIGKEKGPDHREIGRGRDGDGGGGSSSLSGRGESCEPRGRSRAKGVGGRSLALTHKSVTYKGHKFIVAKLNIL